MTATSDRGRPHRHGDADNETRLFQAMVLTGVFMVVEVIGGIYSGSLALLADAGHMLIDTAALSLAWLGFRVGRRSPDSRRSYGYHRFQILAAFVNGVTLLFVVGWIVFEAIGRLFEPVEILPRPMLIVAALGLAVNVLVLTLLRAGNGENLNVRSAALHVLGDLLGSVAAILAAVIILGTGWTPIDPLLSVVVAMLILRSAWVIIGHSAHILLEGTPDWLDIDRLRDDLRECVPGIEDIHHVHVWSLTSERPLLTMHANIRDDADHDQVLRRIKETLARDFGIDHATVEVEKGVCADEAPEGS